MKSPATVYLWNEHVDELRTDAFKEVVRNAQVLFIENLSSDVLSSEMLEEAWNDYTLRDIASNDIADILCYTGEMQLVLVNQALLNAGRGKRVYVEKSTIEPVDPLGVLEARSDKALITMPLADALNVKRRFLMQQARYHQRKEQSIVMQLDDIDESVGIICHIENEGLAGAIGMSRPVDVVLPFPDYPKPYANELERHFRMTGEVSHKLYAQSVAEQLIANFLQNYPGLTSVNRTFLGHLYAAHATPEFVKDFVDRASASRSLRVGPMDFWDSYCSRNALPQVKDALLGTPAPAAELDDGEQEYVM